MTPPDLSQAKNLDLLGAWIAIQRSARTAREIAVRTNTSIVIHRPGEGIVEITAEELRKAGYK